MKKRGQVTIFIILGIVIIAMVGIFLYLSEFNIKSLIGIQTETIPSEILPIYEFVSDCVKLNGEDTLYLIGQQGGYSYLPENSLEIDIPYYFDGENKFLPGKEIIEEQIGNYMNIKMFFCTESFVDFSDFEVAQSFPDTEVIILDNIVNMQVNYPLRIKKGYTTYELSEFTETFEIRLGTIYEAAKEIIYLQEQNPPEICISCIIDLSMEKDLSINIEDYREDNVIFTIADHNSILLERPYKFVFANKYPQNE